VEEAKEEGEKGSLLRLREEEGLSMAERKGTW
jgi:hypothetical protein